MSILLSVRFITRIPTILRTGNSAGTIRNAFSPVVSLRAEKEKVASLFLIRAITARIIIAPPNEISRGTVDKGLVKPRTSSKLFSVSPKSMEKAILSPTDKTIFSTKPSLFNFRMESIRKPGIKVRKIKPETCLRMGISKITAMPVRATAVAMKANHLIVTGFLGLVERNFIIESERI